MSLCRCYANTMAISWNRIAEKKNFFYLFHCIWLICPPQNTPIGCKLISWITFHFSIIRSTDMESIALSLCQMGDYSINLESKVSIRRDFLIHFVVYFIFVYIENVCAEINNRIKRTKQNEYEWEQHQHFLK